jgi:hypothetical protein
MKGRGRGERLAAAESLHEGENMEEKEVYYV